MAQLIHDNDFEHWVRLELYGYNKDGKMIETDVVPEYREVSGMHFDKYNRILEVNDIELDFINSYRFRYNVQTLEALAQKTKMQNIKDDIYVQLIRQYLHVDVFRFCFSPVEISRVLGNIRNILLEKVYSIEENNIIEKNNFTQ